MFFFIQNLWYCWYFSPKTSWIMLLLFNRIQNAASECIWAILFPRVSAVVRPEQSRRSELGWNGSSILSAPQWNSNQGFAREPLCVYPQSCRCREETEKDELTHLDGETDRKGEVVWRFKWRGKVKAMSATGIRLLLVLASIDWKTHTCGQVVAGSCSVHVWN